MSQQIEHDEVRPSKRPRIDEQTSEAPTKVNQPEDTESIEKVTQKETRSGITSFVNPDLEGFSGVIKQRFSDFIVNEISLVGEVLHLKEIAAPAPRAPKKDAREKTQQLQASTPLEAGVDITSPQRDELISLFGEDTTSAIDRLYKVIQAHPQRKRRDLFSVKTEPIQDKINRTKAHRLIREIYQSKLETKTDDDDRIVIDKAITSNGLGHTNSNNQSRRVRPDWNELGGEFLHFNLYKENKDTMEVLSFISSQLKISKQNFQFAGTKDRRAVTTQRISGHRIHSDRLIGFNKLLRSATIGDFKYEQLPLSLGDLQGNEFAITIRDCHFKGEDGLNHDERFLLAQNVVYRAGRSLKEDGFINYFGLQRFGTYQQGTEDVGKALLKENIKLAVHHILAYSPEALAAAKQGQDNPDLLFDDQRRALAINIWEGTKNIAKTVKIIPKRFLAEINIMRHLSICKDGKYTSQNDYQGAIGTIQRSLRLMYTHAYQSLVWNTVAAERWNRYGKQVIEGDLVIVDTPKSSDALSYDEAGEEVFNAPENEKVSTEHTRARPLSKEEAMNGKYSIWDIVLTLPGHDVEYPKNDLGQFYVDFMGSESGGGLDPYQMKRRWKDISLTGGYRKFMARPANMSWEVKTYKSELEQLMKTDLDLLNHVEKDVQEEVADENINVEKIAVLIKMQLGSSQYATIALREMMKLGGLKSYGSNKVANR